MSRTKQSVQRELQHHYQNWEKVREKIALYSEMEAPISLLNQREQIEADITLQSTDNLLKKGFHNGLRSAHQPCSTSHLAL